MKIYWQQYMTDYVACPLLLNWTSKIFKPEICKAKMMASKLIDIAKTINWLLMVFFASFKSNPGVGGGGFASKLDSFLL
jgi:hypothetical protein